MAPNTTRQSHVLVVDDEPMVREVVCDYLRRDGSRVSEATTGVEALELVATDRPDLVVLDVMIPDPDGFEVLRRIRRTREVPVIMLTSRTSEGDRVAGLDLGADDYVVKPFSPRELTARVRSVLRRTRRNPDGNPTNTLRAGDLVVEPASRTATLAGRPLELTPREFDLLAHLMAHPGRAFSRAELLEQVWDSSPEWQDPSTVTVHMRRLRTKIETDPDHPVHLLTVWGVGYRFAATEPTGETP